MPRRILLLVAALVTTFQSVVPLRATSAAFERGYPLIKALVPDQADAGTQNFGIARDARGVLYVANNAGVLIYDGAWWRLVPIGGQQSAFAIAVDGHGRVGVGGVDTFGTLTSDATGTLRYAALEQLLPQEQRGFGQVLGVHPTHRGFLFLTGKYLFDWNGAALRALATFPGDRPYTTLWDIGGVTWVWSREGLARLTEGRIVPVPGGEVFSGRRVDLLLPLGDEAGSGGLLASVRGEGLFRFADGVAEPFARAVSAWAKESRLLRGLRLPDGRLALGSIVGGLALMRPDGAIDQIIDTSVGLPDDLIYGMTLDGDGSLWLALNRGLARLEVASELSLIDQRSGLKGSVYAVARHQGTLYAATAAGLFAIEPGDAKIGGAAADARPAGAGGFGRPVRMRQIPAIPPSVWSLLSYDDELLAGSAMGVYRVRAGRAEPLAAAGTDTVYALLRSERDPARVWVGLQTGLGSLYRVGSGWRFEGLLPAVGRDVRTLAEDDRGRLYCQSSIDGVSSFDAVVGPMPAQPPAVRREIDPAQVCKTSWGLLAAPEHGLLRLDAASGHFVADPDLAGLAVDGVSRIAVDSEHRLWMNTDPLTIAEPRKRAAAGDAGSSPPPRSLVGLPTRDVEALYAESDGVVWIGSDSGLVRFAGRGGAPAHPLPAPLLSRITTADGPPLFGGALGSTPPSTQLPAGTRRLRVEFAPLTDRPGLRYQTRLEPLDSVWSEPSNEPFTALTQLPAGAYTLCARTVGPNGETSPETLWSFRVLPRWYATRWAWALWILLGAGLLGLAGPLRNRALRQRAAALELQVAEKTTELRRTVAELEVANLRLEELSLSDELTGIANRRLLQQRLDEEWSRARRHQLPIALAMLDLDAFKLLNDTRGHLEGDQALQTVAAYLADAVQRRGDVVARYGGEEFAILLPTTDLAGVRSVAESLRGGIEALAIPHPHAPGGRLTASLGYASCVPSAEQRVETLIAAADEALYRAKAAGRNRVESAPAAASASAPI